MRGRLSGRPLIVSHGTADRLSRGGAASPANSAGTGIARGVQGKVTIITVVAKGIARVFAAEGAGAVE